MTDLSSVTHEHVFLGSDHERSERRTWVVIGLCGAMMAAEIIGGALFGSVALVADGLHMSTHAGALLIAAWAYTYARRHAGDRRFVFGTGKLGDLAGFTSAIILAMIALLIGYEGIERLVHPVPIDFDQSIPIAVLGLMVNVASAWLLSGGHHHGHHHGHAHAHGGEGEVRRVETTAGPILLEIFEDGVPPRFRLRWADGRRPAAGDPAASVETVRPDGTRQTFSFVGRGDYFESPDSIAEPHIFTATLRLGGQDQGEAAAYSEGGELHHHRHGAAHRDNNIRAALIHMLADAAVSLLVIAGLLLGRAFGWLWIDAVVGMVGAVVIANWSYCLVRDTGAILLDMAPDRDLAESLRQVIEADGDRLADLHLWRLGPGHLGAILSVVTESAHDAAHYRARLGGFSSLSHVTVEVHPQ